jgi:hypothetical protein
MKEINNSNQLKQHILSCVAKENVFSGSDAKGNFIQVSNLETIVINDKKGKKEIAQGKNFKIYEDGIIGFSNGKENLKPIKNENIEETSNDYGNYLITMKGKYYMKTIAEIYETDANWVKWIAKHSAPGAAEKKDVEAIKKFVSTEISEQIKLPEKENVMIETLISDINENIRQCKMYVQDMDAASLANNETAFKDAQAKLKKEIHSLDANTMELATQNKEENIYAVSVALININNFIVEFEKETKRDMTMQEYQQTKKTEVRENAYALHLKAMMEIKENLGNDELRGTIGNVNGIVQTTGFGHQTKLAMDTSYKHQNEEGVTAVRDDVAGPSNDTTYESVDVDDILTNGETNFSPSFYGAAINEQDNDDRLPNREERTLFNN